MTACRAQTLFWSRHSKTRRSIKKEGVCPLLGYEHREGFYAQSGGGSADTKREALTLSTRLG